MGPAGTEVTITFFRPESGEERVLTITRARVELQNVTWAMLPGTTVAQIRIAGFSERVSDDLGEAISAAEAQGATGVILDLRNNPGGVLESAVEVADQMLEDGIIVTADGRTPASRFSMSATPGEVLPGVRVVVLVNGSTASAAEILAGALQDHHRAVLLGRRTFGKGSVQTVMPLSSGRAIKLTTSRYFTPSGRSIQGSGIEPDEPFEFDGQSVDLEDPRVRQTLAQRDSGVRAALELLKGRKPRAGAEGLTARNATARAN
jgi:carboxyl-terminal processing protease